MYTPAPLPPVSTMFQKYYSKGKRVENNTIMSPAKTEIGRIQEDTSLAFHHFHFIREPAGKRAGLLRAGAGGEWRPSTCWLLGAPRFLRCLPCVCVGVCVRVCVCFHLDCGMPQPLWGCHPPQHRTFYMKTNVAVLF